MEELMTLEIMLPFRMYGRFTGVKRIVLDTNAGSMGVLPRRLDYAAALVPGILEFESEAGVQYVAVAAGLCVKTGFNVSVSVHEAFGDAPLGELKKKIREDIMNRESNASDIRTVYARLETGLVRNLQKLKE